MVPLIYFNFFFLRHVFGMSGFLWVIKSILLGVGTQEVSVDCFNGCFPRFSTVGLDFKDDFDMTLVAGVSLSEDEQWLRSLKHWSSLSLTSGSRNPIFAGTLLKCFLVIGFKVRWSNWIGKSVSSEVTISSYDYSALLIVLFTSF